MNLQDILEPYELTVGGFTEKEWQPWRDHLISPHLKKDVLDFRTECERLLTPILVTSGTRPVQQACLLLEEAAVNQYGHGKKGSPDKPFVTPAFNQLTVRPHHRNVEGQRFRLVMQDDEPEFELYEKRGGAAEIPQPTGNGILLLRNFCRAHIDQIILPEGGKLMVYLWSNPPLTEEEQWLLRGFRQLAAEQMQGVELPEGMDLLLEDLEELEPPDDPEVEETDTTTLSGDTKVF